MSGGPIAQDWEPVVICKKAPTAALVRMKKPSTPPVGPVQRSKLFERARVKMWNRFLLLEIPSFVIMLRSFVCCKVMGVFAPTQLPGLLQLMWIRCCLEELSITYLAS